MDHSEWRLGTQGVGRVLKKIAEKEFKKYIDDVVGHWVEMKAQELQEFWAAFATHVREQWGEFVEREDRDPIF